MFFRRKINERSAFKIFSFYNRHVDPDIPPYQKAVFEKFAFGVNHVVNDKFSHGDFLNHVCRTVTDTDYLIFFDIDCIPVASNWFSRLWADLSERRTLVGAAQTANHLGEGKNLYVSPFFFAVATGFLRELNYPDMRLTETVDAGQNLTAAVANAGGNIKYWWPTHIEEERWPLHHPVHNKFGLGTTYNDSIYHAFFSSANRSARFILKCQSILRLP